MDEKNSDVTKWSDGDEVVLEKTNQKLEELYQRGEIERLRNYGKGLDIIRFVFETGKIVANARTTIATIEAQKGLIEKQIEKIEKESEVKIQEQDQKSKDMSKVMDNYMSIVKTEIPALLDLHDFTAEQKKEIITTCINKLPEMKFDF